MPTSIPTFDFIIFVFAPFLLPHPYLFSQAVLPPFCNLCYTENTPRLLIRIAELSTSANQVEKLKKLNKEREQAILELEVK